MKTMLLIAAALVFPLIWGYLAERLMRRLWPRTPDTSAIKGASSQEKDDQQTHYLDYQI